MRSRLVPIVATAVLILSGCGGSNSSSGNTGPTTSTTPTTLASSTGTSETSTTTLAILDPVSEGQMIEGLITTANADGKVTGNELSEILVATGVPQNQADCEGALLADLGITDPTDLSSLSGGSLTPDQALQLSTCMASAG